MPYASLPGTVVRPTKTPPDAIDYEVKNGQKQGAGLRYLRPAIVIALSMLCAGCATSFKRTSEMHVGRYNLAPTYRNSCDFRQDGLIDLRYNWRTSHTRPVYVPRHAGRAIWKAAHVTGVSPLYLAATAARESNFKSGAAARTSSARGMFQFIEQTWLQAFARDGACLGMPSLARHIRRTRGGRYVVHSRRARRHILGLRYNTQLATFFAARLAQQNAKTLARHLGRRPTPGELYVAHFLGAKDAARMAALARRYPYDPAYREFRKAARANKPIFFRRGRPLSLGEVWYSLTKRHDRLKYVFT